MRAVAKVCLHFGGPLECEDGQFVCPWHGASFDKTTGARFGGPAPKDAKLLFLSTRIDNDAVFYVWGE
jgi:nitrite reductase/ring-hydroxylating ferredoxin subunit